VNFATPYLVEMNHDDIRIEFGCLSQLHGWLWQHAQVFRASAVEDLSQPEGG